MKRQLLWDAGPGEFRAGLIEHGELTEFRIIRHRRDVAHYGSGEHYTARVLRALGPGKALVSLGGSAEALLQPAPKVAEGALLTVEMTRAPVPEPGRWKLAKVRPSPAIAPQAQAGWHFSDEPWVLFLRRMAAHINTVICADAMALTDIRSDVADLPVPVRIDPAPIEAADFDSLIEAAVLGEHPIANGMLSIERSRAMTLIDVDGSGDPLALNLAAARVVPRLLRLYDIGGMVGIDFLTLASRPDRQHLDQMLGEACAVLGPHKRTAVNGFGFAQIVRARTAPSVAEILCETTPGRLSAPSLGVALLRAAGRSHGHGKRVLTAPPRVIAAIRQWPEETAALRHALGVEIELVADPSATGYGHVHVEHF
jgi:ribonuclease G